MTAGRSQIGWFWLENPRVRLATARIVPELTGTVSASVQMMLKSPHLCHSFHWFTPSFNKQLLSNYYMSGTLLGTGNTMVNKTWFLTLMMSHHCSPRVRLYDHIVTDCSKSDKKTKERNVIVIPDLGYCTSNPLLSPEQMLVSASADAVAGTCETSSFRSSSLLIWCSWALISPLLLKPTMPTKVWLSTICIKYNSAACCSRRSLSAYVPKRKKGNNIWLVNKSMIKLPNKQRSLLIF